MRFILFFSLFLSPGNIIVYGNTIDVYTTIESLLSLGISGYCIHLVHPPSNSNITPLNNNAIERAIKKALSRSGVTEHHDSLLAEWNDGNHPDPITCASFTTTTKPFKLQCSVSMRLCCILIYINWTIGTGLNSRILLLDLAMAET